MAQEDVDFGAYLEANGYDTSQMSLRSETSPFVDDTVNDRDKSSA